MNNEKTQAIAGSVPPVGSAFPINPERDENGKAVLYPGRKRYEGITAAFEDAEGNEFVVMAPTLAALNAVVISHRFRDGEHVDADRCGLCELRRMPNAPRHFPARSDGKMHADVGASGSPNPGQKKDEISR